MTLRKITIDNSVRYIPIIEKTKEREIKPKTIKTGSLPHKQSKNCSKNNKKIPYKRSCKWIRLHYKIDIINE